MTSSVSAAIIPHRQSGAGGKVTVLTTIATACPLLCITFSSGTSYRPELRHGAQIHQCYFWDSGFVDSLASPSIESPIMSAVSIIVLLAFVGVTDLIRIDCLLRSEVSRHESNRSIPSLSGRVVHRSCPKVPEASFSGAGCNSGGGFSRIDNEISCRHSTSRCSRLALRPESARHASERSDQRVVLQSDSSRNGTKVSVSFLQADIIALDSSG